MTVDELLDHAYWLEGVLRSKRRDVQDRNLPPHTRETLLRQITALSNRVSQIQDECRQIAMAV